LDWGENVAKNYKSPLDNPGVFEKLLSPVPHGAAISIPGRREGKKNVKKSPLLYGREDDSCSCSFTGFSGKAAPF
jgi:hypothetical protein